MDFADNPMIIGIAGLWAYMKLVVLRDEMYSFGSVNPDWLELINHKQASIEKLGAELKRIRLSF